MSGAPSSRVVATLRTLAVDATTAEVLRALQGAGCRSVLLKGPTFQRALYRDGSRRHYSDTDLLVSPAELPHATAILAELGFALVFDDRDHPKLFWELHAQVWERERKKVDLHWQIPGVGVPAERTWDVLASRTEPIAIGGTVAESLGRPGIAMLVALHAAHHGRSVPKPLWDLERALDQIDHDTWAEAARLAAELDASQPFAAGLRLAHGGERLASDLRLPEVRSARVRLKASVPPPGSLDLLGLLEAPTIRTKARVLRAALLPAPDQMREDQMRAGSRLAAHGRIGLALAYMARVVVRGRQLPTAIRAVRRAREPRPSARPPS